MTTLARWLLRAFADNWPGGLPGDGDDGGPLYLVDREDSALLDVDTTKDPTTLTEVLQVDDFDLTRGNVLSVAQTNNDQVPAGLGGNEYRAEPVLSVRIEAADAREHGHVADSDEFQNAIALEAEDVVRNIDNGTLKSAPLDGFYVAEPGSSDPQLTDASSYYRWQFDVEPRGYRQV